MGPCPRQSSSSSSSSMPTSCGVAATTLTRLADLVLIEHEELRQVRGRRVLDEIQDDIADSTAQMTRRRWPRITLKGFGAVASAAAATVATMFAGGIPLAVGLAVGAGVVGMASGAHDTAEMIREPRYNSRAPLAYAALAAHQFR